MYPLIKSVHFLALYLLLGGPAFWFLVWKPAMGDAGRKPVLGQRLQRAVGAALLLGTLFFAVSALWDALRAASQVIDVRDLAMLRLFFRATQFGRLTIIKGVLALLTALVFWLALRRDCKVTASGGFASGLALLVSVSLASHAASKPGLFPVVSDVVHLLSSVVWAGGVIYLSLLPWDAIQKAPVEKPLAHMVTRFSKLALLAVAVVTATGLFAGVLHVATTMAIPETSYGRTLGIKVALFIAVMLIAGINLLYLGPGLRRSAVARDRTRYEKTVRRLGSLVRLEAVLIVALLLAASALTTLPPPDTMGTVSETTWERLLGTYSAMIRMVPTGRAGQVEIDVHLVDFNDSPAPADVRVYVHVEMSDHPMGTRQVEARQVFPGLYRATSLISMVGRWQGTVVAVFPGGTLETATFHFEAA